MSEHLLSINSVYIIVEYVHAIYNTTIIFRVTTLSTLTEKVEHKNEV